MTSSGNTNIYCVGIGMGSGKLPPGVFVLLKHQLLGTVKVWVFNGWINPREVLEIVGMGMVAGCPVARLAAEGAGRSPIGEVCHLGSGLESLMWETGAGN